MRAYRTEHTGCCTIKVSLMGCAHKYHKTNTIRKSARCRGWRTGSAGALVGSEIADWAGELVPGAEVNRINVLVVVTAQSARNCAR